jgi:hypothetical protein
VGRDVPYVARAASFSRWAKEGPACNDHERRANPLRLEERYGRNGCKVEGGSIRLQGLPRRTLETHRTTRSSNRSPSSSSWIRGAPHKKFAWLIRTISARTSLLIFGHPPRRQPHEPDTQIAQKPRRRQRKMVAGWTTIRLRRQFAHQRDRSAQNGRSLGRKRRRRVPVRCSSAS